VPATGGATRCRTAGVRRPAAASARRRTFAVLTSTRLSRRPREPRCS